MDTTIIIDKLRHSSPKQIEENISATKNYLGQLKKVLIQENVDDAYRKCTERDSMWNDFVADICRVVAYLCTTGDSCDAHGITIAADVLKITEDDINREICNFDIDDLSFLVLDIDTTKYYEKASLLIGLKKLMYDFLIKIGALIVATSKDTITEEKYQNLVNLFSNADDCAYLDDFGCIGNDPFFKEKLNQGNKANRAAAKKIAILALAVITLIYAFTLSGIITESPKRLGFSYSDIRIEQSQYYSSTPKYNVVIPLTIVNHSTKDLSDVWGELHISNKSGKNIMSCNFNVGLRLESRKSFSGNFTITSEDYDALNQINQLGPDQIKMTLHIDKVRFENNTVNRSCDIEVKYK